jgi:cysteine-rich CPXCG protein
MIDEFDDELEGFDAGDGTADTVTMVTCPYCGEQNEIALDPGGGAVQQYVEDCQVCCQPWRVTVRYDEQGNADVSVEEEAS